MYVCVPVCVIHSCYCESLFALLPTHSTSLPVCVCDAGLGFSDQLNLSSSKPEDVAEVRAFVLIVYAARL